MRVRVPARPFRPRCGKRAIHSPTTVIIFPLLHTTSTMIRTYLLSTLRGDARGFRSALGRAAGGNSSGYRVGVNVILEGLEVFCGGPIQALFTNGSFDHEMRALVTSTVAALESAGAVVTSAHITEGFAPISIGPQEITLRDFGWCESCDVYVALLPTDARGLVCPSAGTAVELGWVSARRKPVVVVWDEKVSSMYSGIVRGLDAVTDVIYVDLTLARATPSLITAAVKRASCGHRDLYQKI